MRWTQVRVGTLWAQRGGQSTECPQPLLDLCLPDPPTAPRGLGGAGGQRDTPEGYPRTSWEKPWAEISSWEDKDGEADSILPPGCVGVVNSMTPRKGRPGQEGSGGLSDCSELRQPPWLPALPPPGEAAHPFPFLSSPLPAGLPVRRSLQSPKPCQTSMGTRSGYKAGGSAPCLTHFPGDQHPPARPASVLGNAGLMTGRVCPSSASQAAVPPLG